jgi:hypothetical protein
MQHDRRFKEALSLRAGDILQQPIPVAFVVRVNLRDLITQERLTNRASRSMRGRMDGGQTLSAPALVVKRIKHRKPLPAGIFRPGRSIVGANISDC